MCVSILPTCMCVSGAYVSWKRVQDPLELKFQIVLSCPVGAGNGSQVSAKAASALNH